MSRRPGFVVDHMEDADGGVEPNKFHPVISVQMRCNWPPLATVEEVRLAMAECYVKAMNELTAMRGEPGVSTVERWAKDQAINAALQRDDDYTPEAMDRTTE